MNIAVLGNGGFGTAMALVCNDAGHAVMATAILRGLGAGSADVSSYVSKPPEYVKLVRNRTNLLAGAWRNEVGHSRSKPAKPGALDAAKKKASELDAQIREKLPK